MHRQSQASRCWLFKIELCFLLSTVVILQQLENKAFNMETQSSKAQCWDTAFLFGFKSGIFCISVNLVADILLISVPTMCVRKFLSIHELLLNIPFNHEFQIKASIQIKHCHLVLRQKQSRKYDLLSAAYQDTTSLSRMSVCSVALSLSIFITTYNRIVKVLLKETHMWSPKAIGT